MQKFKDTFAPEVLEKVLGMLDSNEYSQILSEYNQR
jgi:hypothetical protein